MYILFYVARNSGRIYKKCSKWLPLQVRSGKELQLSLITLLYNLFMTWYTILKLILYFFKKALQKQIFCAISSCKTLRHPKVSLFWSNQTASSTKQATKATLSYNMSSFCSPRKHGHCAHCKAGIRLAVKQMC